MKTRFIFIRHAQSVAHERGIVQGAGVDMRLSERGEKQLSVLRDAVAALTFDRMFSSTAVRALETARAIHAAFPSVPYEASATLNERSKGEAEGISKEEFALRYSHIEEAWRREEDPCIPGGESFADVEARVMPLVQKHLNEYSGETLLYVGHGNVFRVILGSILSVPVAKRARMQKDYCAMSVIEYDHETNRWKLICMNRPLVDV